jgi:hypothetical protein
MKEFGGKLMRKSTLLKFMNQHDNWEALLSESPYSLEMFWEDDLALFKYRTGFSDMSLELVREARGIIIDVSRMKVVCWPFHKFFNIQEPYAANIDWSTARVTEKVDGSIIKVWWHKPQQRWQVSTNTRFDAYSVRLFDPLPGDEAITYGDLFDIAVGRSDVDLFSRLDADNTYIFEPVSPKTQIVVSYPQDELTHLGTRCNVTGEEIDIDIGIPKPKEYTFSSLDEVIETAKVLGCGAEGFVVTDGAWNRVKVKSVGYVEMHMKKNNTGPTEEAILQMVLDESIDDFSSVFPRYKSIADSIQCGYVRLQEEVIAAIRGLGNARELPRKEAAQKIIGHPYEAILFEWLNGRFEPQQFDKHLKTMRFSLLARLVLGNL